ncbi:hypothetical protein PSACC_01062 [Paramicrosporidium saccamoebae]|uniref:Uncharacterized protein n=1 Tax=Paramicrosporidium saccamoebae TaxID=1246581 RepID=A0A2H9TN32_9FUNG|nr:hypothetical protein PSACC_01062 [Paramicrosporidium saccamoebae]
MKLAVVALCSGGVSVVLGRNNSLSSASLLSVAIAGALQIHSDIPNPNDFLDWRSKWGSFWHRLLRDIDIKEAGAAQTVIANWSNRPSYFLEHLTASGAETLVNTFIYKSRHEGYQRLDSKALEKFFGAMSEQEIDDWSYPVCEKFVRFSPWLKHPEAISHERCRKHMFDILSAESRVELKTINIPVDFAIRYAEPILGCISKLSPAPWNEIRSALLNTILSDREAVKKHFKFDQILSFVPEKLRAITSAAMAVIGGDVESEHSLAKTDIGSILDVLQGDIFSEYNGPLHPETLKKLRPAQLGNFGERLGTPVCQNLDLSSLGRAFNRDISEMCLIGYWSTGPRPALGLRSIPDVIRDYLGDTIMNIHTTDLQGLSVPCLDKLFEDFQLLKTRPIGDWLSLETNRDLYSVHLTATTFSALLKLHPELASVLLKKVNNLPDDIFSSCDTTLLIQLSGDCGSDRQIAGLPYLNNVIQRRANAVAIGHHLAEETLFCEHLSEDDYKSLVWLRKAIGPKGKARVRFAVDELKYPELSGDSEAWKRCLHQEHIDGDLMAFLVQQKGFCEAMMGAAGFVERADERTYLFVEGPCLLAFKGHISPGNVAQLAQTAFSSFTSADFESLFEMGIHLKHLNSGQINRISEEAWSKMPIQEVNELADEQISELNTERLSLMDDLAELSLRVLKRLSDYNPPRVKELVKPEMINEFPDDLFDSFTPKEFSKFKLKDLALGQLQNLGHDLLAEVENGDINDLDEEQFEVISNNLSFLKSLSGLNKEILGVIEPYQVSDLIDTIDAESCKYFSDSAFMDISPKSLERFRPADFRIEQINKMPREIRGLFKEEDILLLNDKDLLEDYKSCREDLLRTKDRFVTAAVYAVKLDAVDLNAGWAILKEYRREIKRNVVYHGQNFEEISYYANDPKLWFAGAVDIWDLLASVSLLSKGGTSKELEYQDGCFDIAESMKWILDSPDEITAAPTTIRVKGDTSFANRRIDWVKDMLGQLLVLTESTEMGEHRFKWLVDSGTGDALGILFGLAANFGVAIPVKIEAKFLDLVFHHIMDIGKIVAYYEETYKKEIEAFGKDLKPTSFINFASEIGAPIRERNPKGQIMDQFIDFVFSFHQGLSKVFPIGYVQYARESIRSTLSRNFFYPPKIVDESRAEDEAQGNVTLSLVPGYMLTIGDVFKSFIMALEGDAKERLVQLTGTNDHNVAYFNDYHTAKTIFADLAPALAPAPGEDSYVPHEGHYFFAESPEVVIHRGQEYFGYFKKVFEIQCEMLNLQMGDIDSNFLEDAHQFEKTHQKLVQQIDWDGERFEIPHQPASSLIQGFVTWLNKEDREVADY